MTSPPAPQPGWYPDPAVSDQVRWFDGARWTEHVAVRTSPPPSGLGRGYFVRADVLGFLLVLTTLASGVRLVSDVWGYRMIQGWRTDPSTVSVDNGVLLDTLRSVTSLGELLLMVPIAVLFIMWLYQAATSDRVGPAALRHAPGWAIGGWFVPLANWFIPPASSTTCAGLLCHLGW